jgi:SAM-dependent methyltransferase
VIHGDGPGRNEGRLRRGRPSSRGAGWRPLDTALAAYVQGSGDEVVEMRTDLGGSEEIPAALFFRDPAEGGAVERRALEECRGRVLDVGAGVGAFSVPLQRRGLEVTSLEVLPTACEVLKRRGVRDVRRGDLEALDEAERFDTVLAMMNGLGLAGSLLGLERFLAALGARLTRDGQILADSTDPHGWGDSGDGRYGGEVHMQLVHRGSPGQPFPYLFVDPETLQGVATRAGLTCEVLVAEQDGRYLARICLQGS